MGNQVEIWESLPECAGIEVSTLGNVRTLDKVTSSENRTWFNKGRVLKQYKNNGGYMQVKIKIDGKWTTKSVHQLVAQTFIQNPNNMLEVNHKDCDRTNNNAGNLNWCTHQENIAYRDKLGHTARNNASKSPVYAINLATFEVSRFRSQREASRELGVDQPNINAVIKGSRKQAGGYWFVNDDGNAVDVVKNNLHDIGKTGLNIKRRKYANELISGDMEDKQ